MLFDLPDHQSLYAALLARDDRFEGQAFVCVSSTGVFCRLTCPARKPKPENCTFYTTIGECIEAGFRPCKRCHPLQAAALADPNIAALLHALDERPEPPQLHEHRQHGGCGRLRLLRRLRRDRLLIRFQRRSGAARLHRNFDQPEN